MTTKKHEVPEELLSGLLANYKKPEDLIGENGLLKQLTKLLVEKALDAELTEHLGHDRHESVANASGNTRNGKSKKTLKGEFGELPIEVPRDRHGSFEPQLIPKHQTRWNGFDDKIISLYARGMTVREIQAHLQEMYGTEVSPSLISSVTDAVSEEVKAWQARPLDPIYPIVYLDCIQNITDTHTWSAQAVFIHELVNWDARAVGQSHDAIISNLNTLKAKISYNYLRKYNATLFGFKSTGTQDNLYWAYNPDPNVVTGACNQSNSLLAFCSQNGKPNTVGYGFELSYSPMPKVTIALQQTFYKQFLGSFQFIDNSSGNLRSASDNNYTYAYIMYSY